MKTIFAIAAFAIVVVVGVVACGAIYCVLHKPVETAASVAASSKAELSRKPAKTGKTAKPIHRDSPDPIVVTGTVKPEEVIEVCAQVNGMIVAVGTDPSDPSKLLDQGSIVHKGEVLRRSIRRSTRRRSIMRKHRYRRQRPICCNFSPAAAR